MNDPLALWALIISMLSLFVAMIAGVVAYLDYHQVGREEPWKLTKVQDNVWLLERIHRRPATISGFDVTTLCDVVHLSWMNPAALPTKVFRRGSQELLHIKTESAGVFLNFYSREYGAFKKAPRHNGSYQGQMRGVAGIEKLKTWTTALY